LQEAPFAKVPVQLPIPPLATEMLLGMEQDITEVSDATLAEDGVGDTEETIAPPTKTHVAQRRTIPTTFWKVVAQAVG